MDLSYARVDHYPSTGFVSTDVRPSGTELNAHRHAKSQREFVAISPNLGVEFVRNIIWMSGLRVFDSGQ